MCEYYDTKAKIYQNLYKKKYFDDYIIYQDKKYVSLLARRFTALAVKNTEAGFVFLARLLYLCSGI